MENVNVIEEKQVNVIENVIEEKEEKESEQTEKENENEKEKEKENKKEEESQESKQETEKGELVKQLDGKPIASSYYYKNSGLLFKEKVGIIYYAHYSHQVNKKRIYEYTVPMHHLFILSEHERLNFTDEKEECPKTVQECENKIRKCTAKICKLINRKSVDVEVILDTASAEFNEQGYLKISTEISKNVEFEVLYYAKNEDKLVASRKLTFKSERALGRDHKAEYKRKLHLQTMKMLLRPNQVTESTINQRVEQNEQNDVKVEQNEENEENEKVDQNDVKNENIDYDVEDDDMILSDFNNDDMSINDDFSKFGDNTDFMNKKIKLEL